MAIRPIEPAQQNAARIAGALYLVILVIAMFSEFYARDRLIAAGDAAQTAANIMASERLFRIGIVGNLLTDVGDVVLIWALYLVLKPVDRNVALLAAFLRLVECSATPVSVVTDSGVLRLLGNADYLRAIDPRQLQALARFFVGLHANGFQFGTILFGLGSTVFSYLWLQSRYIPRVLAAWGIFSSAVVAIVTLVLMVFPAWSAVVEPAYWVPIFIFEVTLGFWLLVKGLR